MDEHTDAHPGEPAADGTDPGPGRSRRRLWWQAGIGVAVLGLVSAGALGIASATADDEPASQSAAQQNQDDESNDGGWRDKHGGWGGWGAWGWGGSWSGWGPFGEDSGDLLHSEVVLATEDGGTETVLVQKGVASDVGADSITVTSEDDFATTYTVSEDTELKSDSNELGDFAADDEVLVVAPKGGDSPTARIVLDLSEIGWK